MRVSKSRSLSFLSSFLVLSLFSFVAAESNAHLLGRNHGASRRRHAVNHLQHSERDLQKRFDNSRFSFYDAGTNACGSVDQDSDFIVALNTEQWDNGAHCYAPITIVYNGKTAQATITDECMGCPYGGLDFSRGLFDYFSSESQGLIYGTWNYGSGAAPSSSPPPPPPPPSPTPTPTSTWSPPPPPPTTTWSPPPPPPPPPSSSYTPTWSSSSWSSWSSSSSFSSYTPSSTSSSAAPSSSTQAAPVPTAPSFDQGSLNQFNLALVGLGALVDAAGMVQ
ncbi:hypothetical protein AcV7_009072 [Taiwanofungus camphoratus]|nr:hypothetical protein AcV7_009072 [Antrodia cinnamomea]